MKIRLQGTPPTPAKWAAAVAAARAENQVRELAQAGRVTDVDVRALGQALRVWEQQR